MPFDVTAACSRGPVSAKSMSSLAGANPLYQGVEACDLQAIGEYIRMPLQNHYYTKVVLSDKAPVDDSLSSHEIQLILGSPTKLAESALVEFATEFTRHMRMNQGWSTEHVHVEPIESGELPPLGEPTRTEGELKVWIVE